MYIIGDVHGCYKTMLALIEKLPKDEEIIFVGDLIDRGPMSKEVVQWVMDNPKKCRSVVGNHEQMLLLARNEPKMSNYTLWTWNGGDATLDSYFPQISNRRPLFDETEEDIEKEEALRQARKRIDIPKDHLEFYANMPLYIEEGDLFVSHTAWNDKIPWENVLELDDTKGYYKGLTWYRGQPGILPDGRFHVFGHTPIPEPVITEHFANIDTGACFAGSADHGYLTALHYPTMELIHQKNIDYLDVIAS